jgi:hypothetical protein
MISAAIVSLQPVTLLRVMSGYRTTKAVMTSEGRNWTAFFFAPVESFAARTLNKFALFVAVGFYLGRDAQNGKIEVDR